MSLKKRFHLTLCIFLSGCVLNTPPDLARRHRAFELVDQGVILLRQGYLEDAEANFETAYEVGELPQAIDGMGAVAFLRGDLKGATGFFVRAYNNGLYPQALGNLALCHEYLGHIDKANSLYLQAIREDPGNFRTRGNFSTFLTDYISESRGIREMRKARALQNAALIKYNQEQLLVLK